MKQLSLINYTTDDADLDAFKFNSTVSDILAAINVADVPMRARVLANLEFHYTLMDPIGGDRRE